jgi:hypothetical protein
MTQMQIKPQAGMQFILEVVNHIIASMNVFWSGPHGSAVQASDLAITCSRLSLHKIVRDSVSQARDGTVSVDDGISSRGIWIILSVIARRPGHVSRSSRSNARCPTPRESSRSSAFAGALYPARCRHSKGLSLAKLGNGLPEKQK